MKQLPLKKLLALTIAFTLCVQLTQAQVKWGVRGGISSQDIDAGDLFITNQDDVNALKLSVNDADYGFHLGLFLQGKIGGFFIQPEVLFNSNTVNYTVSDLTTSTVLETIKSESYQYLDVPIMMGVKLGPLRLQGGPVGHFFINSSSELLDIEGYEQKFEQSTFGWQAGAGLDIWKFILDVKYEGNFSKYGEHISFFGTQYNFDKNPGKLVASLGIAF